MRVDGPGDADCALERGDPGEYRVHDAAGPRGALAALARALSAALDGLGIGHHEDGGPLEPCLQLGGRPS